MSIVVTAPAVDRALITLAEAKAALGVDGLSEDSKLQMLIDSVSASFARECRVATAGNLPPTLRAEGLAETTRIRDRRAVIVTARRFVEPASVQVVEAGAPIGSDSFDVDGSAGTITRLRGDRPDCWACGKVVITYTAGFMVVPDDLKRAMVLALREQWAADLHDPLVKRENIQDLGEQEFWVGGLAKVGGGPFSVQVGEMLAPYRTFDLP